MSFRYIGNKMKLADWIISEISQHAATGARVADPMCGTASISLALAKAGYAVTASDALTFPVIHARRRLLIQDVPPFHAFGGYADALAYLNNLEPVEGYFFQEFSDAGQPANGRTSRKYFTAGNAAKIDAIRTALRRLSSRGNVTSEEHQLLLHDLILSVNEVANISGTYGYFHRTFTQSSLKALRLTASSFTRTRSDHKVMQGNVEELATSLNCDIVYLDPPYTKRQYAGNYHILETLAREDEPEAQGDGGLRPWAQQSSAFCYRRTAARAFTETLSALEADHVFISYSEDGQVPPSDMLDLLRSFGSVDVAERSYSRYRSSSRVQQGPVTELLFHVRMN